jgi:hypothetical protein
MAWACDLRACGLTYPAYHPHIGIAACTGFATFSTLSHKRDDFGETVIEHKMCIFLYNFHLEHFS